MAKKNEIIQATESEPLVKRKAKKNDNFGEDFEQTEAEKIENEQKIEKRTSCQLCSKRFLNVFQLQNHLVDIHKINGKFPNQEITEKHLQNGNY